MKPVALLTCVIRVILVMCVRANYLTIENGVAQDLADCGAIVNAEVCEWSRCVATAEDLGQPRPDVLRHFIG